MKLVHQMPNEPGSLTPTQLLIRFFSCSELYERTSLADKNRAKSPESGKKEGSTHVFGTFNAQEGERLIAPQHFLVGVLALPGGSHD
jgi:hypothetical protein